LLIFGIFIYFDTIVLCRACHELENSDLNDSELFGKLRQDLQFLFSQAKAISHVFRVNFASEVAAPAPHVFRVNFGILELTFSLGTRL